MRTILLILSLLMCHVCVNAQACHSLNYFLLNTDTVQIKSANHHIVAGMTLVTIDSCGNAIWAPASAAGAWGLTGNAGTNPAINFIGPTDTALFQIFTDGGISGAIAGGGYNVNTSFGWNALMYSYKSYSLSNTAFGSQALSLTTGNFNTAVGYESLYSVTGDSNTAVGHASGVNLQNYSGNCFFGYASGDEATGSYNACIGVSSGSTLSGAQNTYLGSFSNQIYVSRGPLINNSTAIGANALIAQSNSGSMGDTTKPLQWGIGTAAPQAMLHIQLNSAQSGEVGFRLSDGTQGAGKVLTSDASGNASWVNSSDTITIDSIATSGATVTVNPVTLPGNRLPVYTLKASGSITSVTINIGSSSVGSVFVVQTDVAVSGITWSATGATGTTLPASLSIGSYKKAKLQTGNVWE